MIKDKNKRTYDRYKGKVGVRSFRDRLSLRFPRELFEGTQKIVALGLQDNATNRKIAAKLARDIEKDIEAGCFDSSLTHYGLTSHNLNGAVNEIASPPYSLIELLQEFVQVRKNFVAPSTWNIKYKQSLNRLKSSPFASISPDLSRTQSCELYDWLVSNFAKDTSRNTLMTIDQCFTWAIERGMLSCTESPLKGFSAKINQTFPKVKSEINPFTSMERDLIIQAFEESPIYNHYCGYIKFCFFTGCRPSEAIGLEWDDIAPDFSSIRFHRTVVKKVQREGLKTQAQRMFPCNEQLKQILQTLYETSNSKTCVFTNKKNLPIGGCSFIENGWRRILDSLPITYRRPYCMRHTFITLCLDKGMEVKDVARLVGNSPKIIYEHYAGVRSNIEVPIF